MALEGSEAASGMKSKWASQGQEGGLKKPEHRHAHLERACGVIR